MLSSAETFHCWSASAAINFLALGRWIRFRRVLSSYDKNELRNYMGYSLQQAGVPQLITKRHISALVEHSAGNLRLLNVMVAELLTVWAQREFTQLDEQLFLELYSPTTQKKQALKRLVIPASEQVKRSCETEAGSAWEQPAKG